MRWTLKEYLDEHGLTPFKLCTHANISTATVYPIARGTAQGIQLETLQRIVDALQELTGQPVTVGDIIKPD